MFAVELGLVREDFVIEFSESNDFIFLKAIFAAGAEDFVQSVAYLSLDSDW